MYRKTLRFHALGLVVAAVVTTGPLVTTMASADTILTICGFDDTRTHTAYRSIYGGVGDGELELLDPANFSGFGVTGVDRMSALGTLTAGDLDGVDIFFTGLLSLQAQGDLSASEIDLLVEYVTNGGVVIATGDNRNFANRYNPLLAAYGIEQATDHYQTITSLTIQDPSHPILNGTFGVVNTLNVNDAASLTVFPGSTAQVLATNPDGTGSIFVSGPSATQAGAFIFMPDSEPFFSNFDVPVGLGANDNRTMYLNAVAYAVEVASSTNAVVPIPPAAGIGLVGIGIVGWMRRRKRQTQYSSEQT